MPHARNAAVIGWATLCCSPPSGSPSSSLGVVVVGAWLLRSWPERWKAFLLLASVVFFGWWDWQRACVVLAAAGGRRPGTARRRRTAPATRRRQGLAGRLGVAVRVAAFVAVARFGVDGIDARRRRTARARPADAALHLATSSTSIAASCAPAPVVDVALAVSFFPAVVAGPLVRPSELLPQLDIRPTPDARPRGIRRGAGLPPAARRPVRGCGWSRRTSPPSWSIRSSPTRRAHSALEVLVAIYGFTVQLFAYLAGYASMARRRALLLGLRLPDELRRAPHRHQPPAVLAPLDHDVLAWLRDYVYVPLGGDPARRRHGGPQPRASRASLAGLWFVGGWNGLAVGAADGCGARPSSAAAPSPAARARGRAVVGWLITFNVVALGWLDRAGR